MPPSRHKNSPWEPFQDLQNLPVSLLTPSEIEAMDAIIESEKAMIQAGWSPAREAQARGELLTKSTYSKKALPFFVAKDGRHFRCLNTDAVKSHPSIEGTYSK